MNETAILDGLKPLIGVLGGEQGRIVQVIAVIGAIRVPMKMVSAQLLAWLNRIVLSVIESEEIDDDERLVTIMGGRGYRFFALMVDAVFSVKLPSRKTIRDAQATSVAANRLLGGDPSTAQHDTLAGPRGTLP